MKNKLLALILAITMITALSISTAAASYYSYDNKMSTLGMELTSALYLTFGDISDTVHVKGITRVDTGATPVYTSFTMSSNVWYSYYVPNRDPLLSQTDSVSQTVNNASPNSGYYIPQHGLTYYNTIGTFGFGYHTGSATSGGLPILNAKVSHNVASAYSLNEIAEINELMS